MNAFERFLQNRERTELFISLCNEYLKELPDHSGGFCFWITHDKDFESGYSIGGQYFREYMGDPPGGLKTFYVSKFDGPVPARVEFVRWMLGRASDNLHRLTEEGA